jgi:hypothetical protein
MQMADSRQLGAAKALRMICAGLIAIIGENMKLP